MLFVVLSTVPAGCGLQTEPFARSDDGQAWIGPSLPNEPSVGRVGEATHLEPGVQTTWRISAGGIPQGTPSIRDTCASHAMSFPPGANHALGQFGLSSSNAVQRCFVGKTLDGVSSAIANVSAVLTCVSSPVCVCVSVPTCVCRCTPLPSPARISRRPLC